MATADELARAEAAAFDFQMQFYAGGPRDWAVLSAIEAGGAYTATASTTLTADVDADSSEIPVASTTGFTTGVAVIYPEGADEEYEVFAYGSKDANSFNDLTRLFGSGLEEGFFHGVHSSGATVSEWADVTANVLRLELTLEESDSIGTWRAELNGLGYNSRLLARSHALLAMWRFRPDSGDPDTWSAWAVAFLGYIKEVTVSDTHQQEKAWRATVEGVAQYLAETDAPAHQFGRTDLAAGRSVTVSGVLRDPYLERNSGEYIGYPELTGDNLVDGDLATLWVSDDVPEITRENRVASRFSINEVYLQAPTGQPALQWIEIFYKNPDGETDGELKYYHVVNGATTWGWPGEWRENTVPKTNYLNLDGKGRPMDADGAFAILCSNRPRFEERWGVGNAVHVLDWRDFTIGTFSLSTSGGFIGWFYAGGTLESVIWYGTASPDEFGESGDFDGYGPGWTGATIPVPPAGHSFRRDPCGTKSDPDAAGNFLADEGNPTPGLAGDDNPEWFSVDLGALGIELAATLTIGETGQMELTSTLGLTATGYVMIDAEVIAYTGRDDDNDLLTGLTRGVGSTDPAQHPVESGVTQYENDLSVDCHLVRQVQWRRRPVLSGGAFVVPTTFKVLFSTQESPIFPSDPDWDDDWPDYWDEGSVIYVTDFPTTATEWSGVPPGGTVRARHVLMIVREMSDAGRAKMNEFHVYAASGDVLDGDGDAEGSVETPYSGEVVKYLLVDNFGLGESAVTLTDPGTQFGELPTTKARYLQVIRDLCKKTGCAIYFQLDDTVEHRYSPWYPLRSLPAAEITWDRDSARRVELSAPNMHNISQVVLRARNEQEDRLFEVRYPPSPLPLGSELVIDDACLGSVTEACLMSEQIFRRRNGPLAATVVPVGPAEWVRPGQRHLVTWTLDEEGTLLQGRNFIVNRVAYSIDFGLATATSWRDKKWETTIGMQELIF